MKKLCFLCMWLLACAGALYAEPMKQYYNYETGWTELVSIEYKGEVRNDRDWESKYSFKAMKEYLECEAKRTGSNAFKGGEFVPITKLSKREIWLIWQALGEYDIADNEVYSMLVIKSPYDREVYGHVRIKNNGRSFDFCALRWMRD